MARRKNRSALVPESRSALDQFKKDVLVKDGLISKDTSFKDINVEVGKEVGVPITNVYNGNISTKDAGKVGGQIGGRMVKELVRLAQEELIKKGPRKIN